MALKVLEQPKYGRLVCKNEAGQKVSVLKFSYADLLAKRILYENNDKTAGDSFKIKVVFVKLKTVFIVSPTGEYKKGDQENCKTSFQLAG